MSAGRFVNKVYVTNAGTAVSIRVQPETITAWNANGAGTIGPGLPSAAVSRGRRSIGINARIARFRWAGNSSPAGYDPAGLITLPILTQSAYDALVKNLNYPYLTGGLELIGKSNEAIR